MGVEIFNSYKETTGTTTGVAWSKRQLRDIYQQVPDNGLVSGDNKTIINKHSARDLHVYHHLTVAVESFLILLSI